MGGCGKTTLAKELFNRKRSNYCRASFLFDVREAHVTGRLPSLQGKLLKDLFQDQTLNPTSTDEGMGYLKDHLQRSPDVRFLIVVDDIDHVDQLDVLMIMDILNKFCNTLVIVTTRDVGVLIRAGISDGYNLKGMDRNNGRELFCWHAFNQPHSSNEYEMLVEAFVEVCGGLPLSLQVLGRHVHGKPHGFWRSALIQAQKTLPQDVKHRLKISFDALSGEEKQIFMDIACFFIGGSKRSIAERVWEGSGWHAQHSLEMLKDKCLVEEAMNWYNELDLRMHDHLRDLGREMAEELSSPLRLWRPPDLQYLGSMGLKNILAKSDLRCFHSMFDESMSCEVKFFVGQPDICLERTSSVLWLELLGTEELEFPGIPSWVSLQYVQYLIIKFGRFKTLWENRIQAPSQLKKLEIGCCSELEELCLAHLSCLEEMLIFYCDHLKSVSGMSNCIKLVRLKIGECPELEELRLEHLSCLKYISICECHQLESVSGIHDLAELVELYINDCDKLEFECLSLRGMRCLKTITLFQNVKVKHFEVDNCQNLKMIKCGDGFYDGEESSLYFVNSIGLVGVIINGCGEFNDLRLIGCPNLKTVRGNLQIGKLEVRQCPELEELPTFSSRKSQNIMLPKRLFLQGIAISSCEKLRINMADIEELQVESCMFLCHCSNAGIRNCIGNLKNVPWQSGVIGRAVGGAESGLNKYLFSEADKVIELGADNTNEEEEGLEDADEEEEGWTYILCCLVVVDSTTSLEGINECITDINECITYSMRPYIDIDKKIYSTTSLEAINNLLHGAWIITIISDFCTMSTIGEDLKRHGIITKKAFMIVVREDEAWKIMQILHKIVDNLLEL